MAELIEGQLFENKHVGIDRETDDELIIRNCHFKDCDDLIRVRDIDQVTIENITGEWSQPHGNPEKFSRGIVIGWPNDQSAACGAVDIKRWSIQQMGPPSGDYGKYNRDCISIEKHNGLVRIAHCYFGGTTDGVVDGKSNYQIFNCHIGPAHRQLRIWDDVTARSHHNRFIHNPGHARVWKDSDGPGAPGVLIEGYDTWLEDPFWDYDEVIAPRISASGNRTYSLPTLAMGL